MTKGSNAMLYNPGASPAVLGSFNQNTQTHALITMALLAYVLTEQAGRISPTNNATADSFSGTLKVKKKDKPNAMR